MKETTLDAIEMKNLLKVALVELFQENKDAIVDLFSELLEDIAMEKAIIEGEDSEEVSRDEIFDILDS